MSETPKARHVKLKIKTGSKARVRYLFFMASPPSALKMSTFIGQHQYNLWRDFFEDI
jgi:hypothetical protein